MDNDFQMTRRSRVLSENGFEWWSGSCIQKLVPRLKKYIAMNGDYLEK